MLVLTIGKERKRKDKEKKDLKMMSYNETVSHSTSDKKKKLVTLYKWTTPTILVYTL